MGARKSSEVARAVALVTSGRCGVHKAAQQVGVSPSSIYRDAGYKAWIAAKSEENKA